MSNAEVPISKATIVLTLIKHVAATGGLDVIWGAQKACAVAGLPMGWDTPVIHRTTAFASKEELVKITGVTVSGMANQAKEEMANNMVVALDNLTNAAVEKNGTIKTLVKATLALTKAVDGHNTSFITLTPTLTSSATSVARVTTTAETEEEEAAAAAQLLTPPCSTPRDTTGPMVKSASTATSAPRATRGREATR